MAETKKKKSPAVSQKDDPIHGLQREILELTALYEISKAVNSSLHLEEVTRQVLAILHKTLGMERGTLSLFDPKTQEISIHGAHGLNPDEIRRGRYQIGEGITGKVLSSGEPIAIPNAGKEPLFLNRTRSRDLSRNQISFLCVPIKLDQKTVGVLSVDRLFQEDVSLQEDIRLLEIIASLLAQALRIQQMVQKEEQRLSRENVLLRDQLKKKYHPANIIGESKRMAEVYASIQLVCQTRATVLLRGESGTGKELVAHAIHYSSDRADKPFVKISCAALPETLLESELFGYEKGAFTGAAGTKKGRFELANGGTLFLDEIGDISLSTQVKLLRVLQEKEFERLGGTDTLRVDVRLVAATNKNLEREVQAGRFRQDLYYRLNVFPVFLPALREKKEDIPVLVSHFLKRANQENKKAVKFVSDEAMGYLMNYSWPGNVRELENAIERAVILCQGDTVLPEHFPIPGTGTNPALMNFNPSDVSSELADPFVASGSLTQAVEGLERRMIMDALEKTHGNQRKAASVLSITERMLGYKMRLYGLKK